MTIRERIIELAQAEIGESGPEPWAREAGMVLGPNDRPSWCALFVRAIWRRAGLHVPDWRMGEGNVSYLRRMGAGELLQPGDLGYVEKFGHNAIVVHDDGITVRSIDGNVSGHVVNRMRPRSDYAAFYSIDPLLAAAREAPTEPAPTVPTVLGVSPVEGPQVKVWQRALVAAGYPVAIDGKFGARTAQAILEFGIGKLGG